MGNIIPSNSEELIYVSSYKIDEMINCETSFNCQIILILINKPNPNKNDIYMQYMIETDVSLEISKNHLYPLSNKKNTCFLIDVDLIEIEQKIHANYEQIYVLFYDIEKYCELYEKLQVNIIKSSKNIAQFDINYTVDFRVNLLYYMGYKNMTVYKERNSINETKWIIFLDRVEDSIYVDVESSLSIFKTNVFKKTAFYLLTDNVKHVFETNRIYVDENLADVENGEISYFNEIFNKSDFYVHIMNIFTSNKNTMEKYCNSSDPDKYLHIIKNSMAHFLEKKWIDLYDEKMFSSVDENYSDIIKQIDNLSYQIGRNIALGYFSKNEIEEILNLVRISQNRVISYWMLVILHIHMMMASNTLIIFDFKHHNKFLKKNIDDHYTEYDEISIDDYASLVNLFLKIFSQKNINLLIDSAEYSNTTQSNNYGGESKFSIGFFIIVIVINIIFIFVLNIDDIQYFKSLPNFY